MELRDLEVFLTVATELHFGRAADHLHVSQPMVSQAVVRLEQQLRVRLFDRTSRVVRLTAAGATLRPQAERILLEVGVLRQLAAKSADGTLGSLRLGVIPSMGWRLQRMLMRFAEAQPGVSVTVSTGRHKDMLAALRSGDLDLAVLRQGTLRALPGENDQRGEFGFARLWTEPVLVVLPQRHPLAALPAIPLSALASMPVMLSPRAQHPDLFDAFLDLCRNAGVQPVIGPPFQSAEAALANVAASADLWFPLHAQHNALVQGEQRRASPLAPSRTWIFTRTQSLPGAPQI